MKIVHLVCTFPPYHGGMGNSVKQMVERLVDDSPSDQIIVVCPDYNHKSPTDEIIQLASGNSYIVKRGGSWIKFGNAAILKGLNKIWQSADIVHFHYPFYGTDGLIWYLKTKYPATKLIIHYHMDSWATGWRNWLFKIFRWLFLKRLLKQCQLVTCASLDYWQSSIAGRLNCLSADQLREIPFTVDTDLFKPRPKDSRLLNKYNLLANCPTVLLVGGLDRAHYFKGVEVLLRALAQLVKNDNFCVQAIIAGDGDLRSDYQELANQLGLAKNIVWTGRVSNQDLPLIYNLADLFVFPSINSCEAFGLVLLEAMASGLPCLAADLPGVRRVIDPPTNGLLIKPGDEHDLAVKLKLLLADQQKLIAQGQASRCRAEKIFSANQQSQLPGVYHEVIDYDLEA